MTNRDRLLKMLAELTNDQLAEVVNDGTLYANSPFIALEKEYCIAEHDDCYDSCPHKADGVPCVACIEDWLGREAPEGKAPEQEGGND